MTTGSSNLPATNQRRRILRREDGHRDLLQAHADAQEHAAGSELAPGLGDGHAEGGDEGEDGGEEDDAASAEDLVEGVGDPAGAVGVSGLRGGRRRG